jgi:hypothetical protein
MMTLGGRRIIVFYGNMLLMRNGIAERPFFPAKDSHREQQIGKKPGF